MIRRAELSARLFLLVAVATGAGAMSPGGFPAASYAPAAGGRSLDTLRVRLATRTAHARRARAVIGTVIPGYLSSRGLPPVPGRFTVTDTGFIFRSVDGSSSRFPAIVLAYIDGANSRPAYLFRVDAGVFETDTPGPLLDLASRPFRLEPAAFRRWPDGPLVSPRDSAGLWATARGIASSAFADSLYTLFGRPKSAVGLVGPRGRTAGRLGEYMGGRDSLALDPGRMTGTAQLRHTLAHELGHRWQLLAPAQLAALWRGVAPVRDPKRYGYGNASEHQAEAIAFAINFLQTTASDRGAAESSVNLLDHYELLVPGTRTMVRYLALQPLYRAHPLRGLLTTGH